MSSSIHPIRQYAAVDGVKIHLVTANENADLAIQAAQRYWGMSWDLLSKQLGMRIEPIITYVPEPGSEARPDDAEKPTIAYGIVGCTGKTMLDTIRKSEESAINAASDRMDTPWAELYRIGMRPQRLEIRPVSEH